LFAVGVSISLQLFSKFKLKFSLSMINIINHCHHYDWTNNY